MSHPSFNLVGQPLTLLPTKTSSFSEPTFAKSAGTIIARFPRDRFWDHSCHPNLEAELIPALSSSYFIEFALAWI